MYKYKLKFLYVSRIKISFSPLDGAKCSLSGEESQRNQLKTLVRSGRVGGDYDTKHMAMIS